MTPNESWFVELKKLNGGVVLLGNNQSCSVTGIGTVRLKLHDGIERTLQNVRLVPGLKRNLISLGMLDQMGCKIKLENEVLKVIRGSITLMKGERINGLYSLLGKTVIGTVSNVSSNVTDKASLWHKRLGHVSEKGLIELGKQGLLNGDKIKNLDLCKYCVLGKASRVKFGTASQRTKGTLDYLHADL